jgi:hypothetical protein
MATNWRAEGEQAVKASLNYSGENSVMQIILMSLFVVLPTIIVVVGGILFWAMAKEAFWPANQMRPSSSAARLPLIRGGALREWTCQWCKSLVDQYGSRPWTRRSAANVAREAESQASFVIDRVLPENAPRRSLCTERGVQPVRLSVPEALAIAEELHARLPAAEVRRVLRRAEDNEALSQCRDADTCRAALCPLLADDGRCLVFGTRPLECRGHCGLPRGPAPESADATMAPAAEDYAASVTDGMQAGLSTALAAAGLDGQRYELNHALTAVLADTQAVERWTRGERLVTEPAVH